MSRPPKRGSRLLAAIGLLPGLAVAGCARWYPSGAIAGRLPFWPGDATQQTTPGGGPDDVRAVLARGSDAEGRSVWIRAIRPAGEASEAPRFRFRYPDLDELLTRPAAGRPELRRALADADPIVATNAAIGLARHGEPAGLERLAQAVRSRQLKLPMRLAAVESLAALQGPQVVPQLRELLDQYGRAAPGSGTPYLAELHAELIRGLARHVDAADDLRFAEALQSRSARVCLEALEAWTASSPDALPVKVVELRCHADPDVRAAALKALARQRHGSVHAYLEAALRDHDLRVRTAAVEALGELGGSRARASLLEALEHESAAIRAAAVSALAEAGAEQPVLEAARDPAWRVRAAVAGELARYPDRRSAATARRLLDDPSVEVQLETVRSVDHWPLEQAGPLLLEAMGKRSFATRKAAADRLAARWPPAAEFPLEGPAARRASMVEQLRGDFRKEFGDATASACATVTPVGPAVLPQQVARVEQLLERADADALVALGPGVLPALEQIVFRRQRPLPEFVYRRVLPRCDPTFVILDRLASGGIDQRRRAAEDLARLAAKGPLPRLAVWRLSRLAAAESDALVWQGVLAAVADDAREPALRLAYAAVGHRSQEVRRRACEHLASHPSPQHAQVLLPALSDESPSVQCAAARALGLSGGIGAVGPLRELLRSGSEPLRLEAAVALARLGDPSAVAALERLGRCGSPKVRREVARAMGEIRDRSFAATLVRMLDDRVAVRRAALESLPKVTGRTLQRTDDGHTLTAAEQVRRWKNWYQQQGSVPRNPEPSGDVSGGRPAGPPPPSPPARG